MTNCFFCIFVSTPSQWWIGSSVLLPLFIVVLPLLITTYFYGKQYTGEMDSRFFLKWILSRFSAILEAKTLDWDVSQQSSYGRLGVAVNTSKSDTRVFHGDWRGERFQVFQNLGTIPTNCGLIPSFLDNDVHIFIYLFFMLMALSRRSYKVYCATSQSKVFAFESPKPSWESISKSGVHFTDTRRSPR